MRSQASDTQPRAESSTGRGTRIAALLLIVLVNLVCLELFARAATRSFLRQRGLTYVRDFPESERFERYLEERHPLLGWPAPGRRAPDLDALGGRVNTHFPDVATPPCASVYGDSFAYSDEVEDADAWPNRLSALLHCRVNNFGVGGYGTDQAFLRMRDQREDRAPLLILAHASVDIVRNLIPFDAFRGGDRLGFKPRFRLAPDGRLLLEPLPSYASLEEWESVYRDPAKHWNDVWLMPGTEHGLPLAQFPYLVSLIRALRSWEMRTFFEPDRVYFEELYEADHPSQALPLTEAIVRAFCHEAELRGGRCLVVLIPVARDLLAYAHTGRVSYRPLHERLAQQRIPVVDIAETLLGDIAASGEDHCVFYRDAWYAKGGCTGHFNRRGYSLVADGVAQRIRREGWPLGPVEPLRRARVPRDRAAAPAPTTRAGN